MSVEAVLSWLLLSSIAATVLAAFVLAVRRPVRRLFGARVAVWLWAAPGLRLVLPPLGFGLLRFASPEAEPVGAVPAADPVVLPTALAARVEPVALPEPVAETAYALPSLAAIAFGIWLTGAAAAIGVRLLATDSWRRTLLREAVTTPEQATLETRLRQAAQAVGYAGPVKLVVSRAAASPQVTGLRAPVIAVPENFTTQFTQEEQRLALRHELIHLARRDLVTLAAAEALCAMHWFNPLLARCLRSLRADQEAACDEAVRAGGVSTAAYAGTLLRAARGPAVPALTLNHDLKRRIETMKQPLPRAATRLLGTVSVAALALGVAAATQETDDPNFETEERSVETASDTKTKRDKSKTKAAHDKSKNVSVWRWSGDGEDGSVRIETGGVTEMVLLSDPFAEIMPQQPEPPEGPEVEAPAPPTPPSPPVMKTPARVVIVDRDGGTRRVVDLKPGERITTEDGTEVIVPPVLGEEFAEEMEAFGARMEEWSEEFDVKMEVWEARHSADFERFGKDMEAWSEKVEAVAEAVEDLDANCDDHRDRTDRPTILTARVSGTGDVVKAVCASGGAERYASEEIARFVARASGLTAEERAYFAAGDGRVGTTVVRR